jgi:hypothetical protein
MATIAERGGREIVANLRSCLELGVVDTSDLWGDANKSCVFYESPTEIYARYRINI